MFKKTLVLFLSLISFSGAAFSAEMQNPEFIFVQEANHQSYFEFQIAGGMLDSGGFAGAKGSPIVGLFKANYGLDSSTNLFIDLPFAGTISGANDDFGIGNISIGGNHQFLTFDRTTAGIGLDITFPSAQDGSLIGFFTRKWTSFIDDQYAISPYIDFHYSGDRVIAAVDIGLNQQIFDNTALTTDNTESTLFYDAGINVAISGPKDLWATLEFGGYTTLTYSANNSEFFGGPGLRYQTDAFALGLHILAPFSSFAKDNIDLLAMADIRFKF